MIATILCTRKPNRIQKRKRHIKGDRILIILIFLFISFLIGIRAGTSIMDGPHTGAGMGWPTAHHSLNDVRILGA
jgi:hypothetical protein